MEMNLSVLEYKAEIYSTVKSTKSTALVGDANFLVTVSSELWQRRPERFHRSSCVHLYIQAVVTVSTATEAEAILPLTEDRRLLTTVVTYAATTCGPAARPAREGSRRLIDWTCFKN
ncbi:hypothetical protein EVAR_11580_1 [Eumeta japonica]|uniref:Uncharacterized protein n=1 Tax=Eumeta variegata TaxID=151549 RepID=A0A4C1X569_EUMVA|nr:hypothetical protein EVAR_11580_1 [Eumeta japonica]